MDYRPVLEVTRGPVVESVHHGAVAVCDREGAVVAWWGDPEVVTYLRSSAKPFQALPLLESGAADHFGFSDREIALACASHSGTDRHVEVVRSMQAKAGLEESHLQCGIHPPYDKETARRLEAQGEQPTANRHNCSGKHTGMLALAHFLDVPLERYLDRDHPVQQRILEALAAMCGFSVEEVAVGTDGCSAPNFAIPLRSAAAAYARLADPSGLPPGRAEACRRIFAAMTGNPEMVAGPGRFDTRLMQVTGGRILAKGGAEGFQGIAIPAGSLGPGSPALGVALKIADGNLGRRAGGPVVLAVLEMLGALSPGELEALSSFGPQKLTNFRGLEIGETRTCFRLDRAEA